MPNGLRCASVLLFIAAFAIAGSVIADSRPEILHYRFNGNGLTTPNSASNPPPANDKT